MDLITKPYTIRTVISFEQTKPNHYGREWVSSGKKNKDCLEIKKIIETFLNWGVLPKIGERISCPIAERTYRIKDITYSANSKDISFTFWNEEH